MPDSTRPIPNRSYFGEQIGSVPGIEYDCLASAAWIDEQTLNMEVYITDIYLGGLRISFAFKGEEIGLFLTNGSPAVRCTGGCSRY